MRYFAALFLRMALAGTTALVCAKATEVASQETARGITDQRVKTMKIRMDVEGTVIMATLDDNETSRDFASLLPLALTLEDYAGTEKISDLPRRLSTAGTPPGTAGMAGNIAYYAPWGNLALFYRDGSYAKGLVRLGRVDTGVATFASPKSLNVIIEAIEWEEVE